MNTGSPEDAPRWSLDPVYGGVDSDAFRRDRSRLEELVAAFEHRVADDTARRNDAAGWLAEVLETLNEILDTHENLEAFLYASYSTDTTNARLVRELDALQEVSRPLQAARARFRNRLAELGTELLESTDRDERLTPFRFFLEEERFYADHQMSPAEEDLAADLSRPGGDAWSRLQQTVSSTLSAPWDNGERRTVVELRGLANDPDRETREHAYNAELHAWRSVEIPLAAALNGVKGFAVILDGRRGFSQSLERAVFQSRISRDALDALIEAMEESLPVFRRYLATKARLIGVPRLAFFDLFAPVGTLRGSWSFADARAFILKQFGAFSEELASFAEQAFDRHWIDAELREGKVGGGYCISFPRAGESRILCNFDGSFGSVATVAHELGHAYHHHVLKDAAAVHRDYPMTLAETASIFCETIVFSGGRAEAEPSEELHVLEQSLQDAAQVIVDILSRFRFETMLFDRRRDGALGADELCELMRQAQLETYGDGLDKDHLHPYMWAVKGHYYDHDRPFYNFPYAFGQLFGLGLYAQYEAGAPGFADRYRAILSQTGRASAVDVTREAGFDIEQTDFWRSGIELIAERVDRFIALAEGV
jgi:pepF/M3 family oligoendopeptidase